MYTLATLWLRNAPDVAGSDMMRSTSRLLMLCRLHFSNVWLCTTAAVWNSLVNVHISRPLTASDKRVSLSKCMHLFVCLACTLLRIQHISTLISHLYAWQIMSAHTRLWKDDSVFVDVKHQRVSGITSSLSSCFVIQKKNKGRQESSEGSGVFLSHSVSWGLLNSLTKDQNMKSTTKYCKIVL